MPFLTLNHARQEGLGDSDMCHAVGREEVFTGFKVGIYKLLSLSQPRVVEYIIDPTCSLQVLSQHFFTDYSHSFLRFTDV